jgi:hypothetical protein
LKADAIVATNNAVGVSRSVMKLAKKTYSKRTDTEKLESNWTKTLGLFERAEYSMAIIRAGTCAEIAANILIRSELVQKRGLDPLFVDSLLRWANGLQGKFSRIILPLFAGSARHATLKKHIKEIGAVNDARNELAHGGHFASKKKAESLLRVAHSVCNSLISHDTSSPKLRQP